MPTLYRVARRLAATAEDAEDLVCASVERALINRDSFDGRHLRSWLIAILRNEFFSEARYQRRRPVDELPEDLEVAGTDGWSEVADRLEAGAILRALEEIPESYRMAVHLFDVEEMSYQEVADALDIPIGTVRSRISRGRQLIRRKLGGEVGVSK